MSASRVLLPAFLLAFTAAAASAQTPAPHTISVNGNAEVRVAPDEVILSVGVETDSKDIAAARSENDTRVKPLRGHAGDGGRAAIVLPRCVTIYGNHMEKTTLYLDAGDYRRLKRIAASRKRAPAALVREAVAEYVARHELPLPKSPAAQAPWSSLTPAR